jgi:hypothetical protein
MNVEQYQTGECETRTSMARGQAYLELLACAIRAGQHTSFTIRGGCMWPALRPGDRVSVGPLQREPRLGDVLICHRGTHLVAHRVVQHVCDAQGQSWIRCRGDAALELDAPLRQRDVLGIVAAVERAGRSRELRPSAAWTSRVVAPLRAACAWLSTRSQSRRKQ